MPIPFTCPHCGKSMVVDNRFAGQSGPCAACGQPITIPGEAAPTPFAPPTRSGGGVGPVLAIFAGLAVIGVCVIGILLALLLPAVSAARNAGRRSQSLNNLKQIGLAMHMYHNDYQSFPPAYVADAKGKPLYSWRVLLLPYLEQKALYDRFDKTKAWDSPENLAVSSTMMKVYQSPADPTLAPDGTSYFCFVGPNTMFPGAKAVTMAEVTDGLSNTLMVIETQGIPGSWAKPNDLDVSQVQLSVGKTQNDLLESFPNGTCILMADGSARFLPSASSVQTLPLLINRQDGRPLPPNF